MIYSKISRFVWLPTILFICVNNVDSQNLSIRETLQYIEQTVSEIPYQKSSNATEHEYEFQYLESGNIKITHIETIHYVVGRANGMTSRDVSEIFEFNILDLDLPRSLYNYEQYRSEPFYLRIYPKEGKSIKVQKLKFDEIESIKNVSGDDFISLFTINWHKGQNIYNAFQHIYDLVIVDSSILASIPKDPFEQRVSTNNLTDKSNRSNVVKLTPTGSGLYEVPVIINGVLSISFILDSGASSVSLSSDVALTLMRTGSITQDDFLEPQVFTLADGSQVEYEIVKLKSIEIGNHKLTNVKASISDNIEAPMLIGSNVLSQLGKITINYENNTLIIK